MIVIKETKDFSDWFADLNHKEQIQVAARLERIKTQAHFGDVKNLGKVFVNCAGRMVGVFILWQGKVVLF